MKVQSLLVTLTTMVLSPQAASVFTLPLHLHHDYGAWLIERHQGDRGSHVVTLNAEMAILAENNVKLAAVIRDADLVIPDGAGIVLYLKMRGQTQKRCPGIELAESLMHEAAYRGWQIAFYGGKPDVVERAAESWRQRYPNLQLLVSHGYLTPEEENQWIATLAQAQPQLILVGMGVPRQEFWIHRQRPQCPQSIWMGIGGSFDIWSGLKTRAPRPIQALHLEWLYRLYQEPWRWRRMQALPQFLWRAIWHRS